MNESTDAVAMFAPLWRRKWAILAVGVLAAVATYAYYSRQPRVYTATTQLYLGASGEPSASTTAAQGRVTPSDRTVADQTQLINSNLLGEAVRQQLRSRHESAAAKGKARAKATTGSDFLTISAEAHTARGAAELANAYAQVYIARRYAGYRREIRSAIANTRQQLRRIEATQTPPSAGAAPKTAGRSAKTSGASAVRGASSAGLVEATNLASRIDQLETDLSTTGAQQIGAARPAAFAASPRPKRNAIFGLLLGLLLASVAVHALSRFDGRLRSLEDVEAAYRTPLLAALPRVGAPIARQDGRPVAAAVLREPLRRLYMALRLAVVLREDGERSPRSILLLSADSGDGKSTLAAGLALELAQAGERVALIEADMRRPVQAELLAANDRFGLAEALAGTISTTDALQAVGAAHHVHSSTGGDGLQPAPGAVATVVERGSEPGASVIVGGGPATNPPALLAGTRMRDLLRAVGEDHDTVLIDAPPPLALSDTMPLLASVDGIVIVARVGHTRQASARRLMQLLERTATAPVLGVVAGGASGKELERFGFCSAHEQHGLRRKLVGL